MVFNDYYLQFLKQLSRHGKEEAPLDVKCIHCTREVRVSAFTQLRKGDHIKVKGENLRFNVGNKQVGPYTHHAIVKEISIERPSVAELTLIEFMSTTYDSKLIVRETRKVINLYNEDIHIIRYQHKIYSPDIIIKRAETFVEGCQKNFTLKYSLFTCNCEHFCHWCCTGNDKSYQIFDFKESLKKLSTCSANLCGKILRVALKLVINSVDDISSVTSGCTVYGPWVVVGVFGALYFIYCLDKHRRLNKQKEHGNICQSCCTQQQRDMWLKFAVYAITNGGGLGLMTMITTVVATKGLIIAGLVLVSILTVGFMWLKPKLGSPFSGRKVTVRSMNNIWQGDIISFKRYGFMHDAVVTKTFPDKNDDKKGIISVVHYSNPGIFRRREIIEEDLHVDLRKETIFGHVYEHYKCHEPEIVVFRARMRIGETKFGAFSNRSCHFCHWAKVVEDEDCNIDETKEDNIEYIYASQLSPYESFSGWKSLEVDHRPNRKHATKELGNITAKMSVDVKPGQLIMFKMRLHWHEAVVTYVRHNMDKPSQLDVTVVHYGKRREVTEDEYSFDLNEVDIWIYKYHPLYRYSSQDVVRRARARVGEKKYNVITHNSSHFCKEIVEKQRFATIKDFDEICPGEAIILELYFWASKHAAIVVDVIPDKSNNNKSAEVTIVHYAPRTISMEKINLNLNQHHVYKMNFDGCYRYPHTMIVKRAKSRLGEKRFLISSTTSWEFVHWASVVQCPIIVEIKRKQTNNGQEAYKMDEENVQQRLLLPKVINPSGKFQKVSVLTWMDLQLGDIVEYWYYCKKHQGIVSNIFEEGGEIKVIHYGKRHIFAVRTIIEDTHRVDFKRDRLVVYRTDPRNCYSRADIVERARLRLGEQRWRSGHKSWDMCLACVLTDYESSKSK